MGMGDGHFDASKSSRPRPQRSRGRTKQGRSQYGPAGGEGRARRTGEAGEAAARQNTVTGLYMHILTYTHMIFYIIEIRVLGR